MNCPAAKRAKRAFLAEDDNFDCRMITQHRGPIKPASIEC
jgi:hypothetical protein